MEERRPERSGRQGQGGEPAWSFKRPEKTSEDCRSEPRSSGEGMRGSARGGHGRTRLGAEAVKVFKGSVDRSAPPFAALDTAASSAPGAPMSMTSGELTSKRSPRAPRGRA